MNRNIRYITTNTTFGLYFKAASEEVIVMHSEKKKTKYMKEDVWKSFFRKLAG